MKRILLLCSVLSCGYLAPSQVYYSQDFEGTGIPAGWGQNTMASDGGWNFGTNTQLQSQSFPINPHTKMAATNDDKCNCNKNSDLLFTMPLDLTTAGTQVFMTYANYYFNQSYQGKTEVAKIKASTDGGTTWTDLVTVPANNGTSWQTNSVDLSAYSGVSSLLIGFHYSDAGGWLYGWAIDDISVFTPPTGIDLSVGTLEVGKTDPRPVFITVSKYLAGLPLDIRLTVTNEASLPITSFDVAWTDGTNNYNQSVTGINLTTLQSYTFYTATPYTTLSGNQSIDVTVSNINSGATELNTANNMLGASVQGVTAHPDAHYLAEEGTGTWCGWCPRGDVYMHYMREQYPTQFVGIAVHNGDAMTVAAYDGGLGITGFPGVKVNRQVVIDPSQLESDFINRIVTAPPATLSGTAVLNLSTNELVVDLTGNFTQALSGNYKLAAVLKEDSVHVNSSGYNQVNYYANNAAGPMGGFQSMPATIPAAQMYYDFVGRALLGGFSGQTGSLPGTITAGSSHSYQFTYTVQGTIDVSQITITGILLNGTNGNALQATDIPVTTTTGIAENNELALVSLYPNPVTDQVNITAKLLSAQRVTLVVTDALGRVYRSVEKGTLGAGVHHFEWDASPLSSGVYFLTLETGTGKTVTKFTK